MMEKQSLEENNTMDNGIIYGGKYLVKWKKAKDDKTDALMRSFDTTIEANSYIKGFVDAIVSFTKDANEDKLLQEFKVEEIK